MSQFETMLEGHDPPLVAHLRQLGLKPEYYALRWLTMFFAQDFELPEVLRLWDSLLASPHRVDFVLSVCCSMMMHGRNNGKKLMANPSEEKRYYIKKLFY